MLEHPLIRAKRLPFMLRLLGELGRTNTPKTLRPLSPRTSGTPTLRLLGVEHENNRSRSFSPERNPRDSKHKRSETCPESGPRLCLTPSSCEGRCGNLRFLGVGPPTRLSRSPNLEKLHASKARETLSAFVGDHILQPCPERLGRTLPTSDSGQYFN